MTNSSHQIWLPIGAVLAGLSVLLGAFGAHGLESFLEDMYAGDPALQVKRLGDWTTAAQYQMYHALGLMLLGCAAGLARPKLARVAGLALLFGTVIFSGCLYLLVLSGVTILGAIVPIGGVSMILGWGMFAAAVWPRSTT